MLKGGKGNSFAGDQENPDQLEDVADDDATEVSKGGSDKERAAAADKAVEEAMRDDRRDPDARPPHGYQKITVNIHHFGQWLKKPETIFALRFSFVSIVLWLPREPPLILFIEELFADLLELSRNISIFGSNFLRAKALVGSDHGSDVGAIFITIQYCRPADQLLVLTLSGLAVYSGDQILSTIQRLIGTALGLVYGMLIFYIGSESFSGEEERGGEKKERETDVLAKKAGNGGGNRIGLGAAFYCFFTPLLAIRLFAPPATLQGTLLLAVTPILVVSFTVLVFPRKHAVDIEVSTGRILVPRRPEWTTCIR